MRKKSFLFILMLSFVMIISVACGSADDVDQSSNSQSDSSLENNDSQQGRTEEKVELVAAHVTAVDTPYDLAMNKFKDIVEEESNGTITVSVHPAGELGGNEDELVQKMSTGTVDLAVAAPGFMAQTVKEVDFIAVPYLFQDYDHWVNVVDGEVGQELTEIVEEQTQFKVMGYWKAGIRDTFGNKPIEKPSDLEGVKIRVQDSPVINKVWSTFGAQPTGVAFNELYQALQNKVVDAAENDFTNILAMKFHEVAPYISLTEHDVATRFFLMSGDKFESLSDDQKEIIEKAAEEATAYEREVDNELAQESLEELKAGGAEIIEVDKESFIELVQPIQDEVAQGLGLEHLLEKVRELK